MIDDYHNVHAKNVPVQLVTSRAIHYGIMFGRYSAGPSSVAASKYVNSQVKVKGEVLVCYGGIDEEVISSKMQQALVNMRRTFMTQLPPVMLKLDPKKLKESLRQLRQLRHVYPVNYKRGQNN